MERALGQVRALRLLRGDDGRHLGYRSTQDAAMPVTLVQSEPMVAAAEVRDKKVFCTRHDEGWSCAVLTDANLPEFHEPRHPFQCKIDRGSWTCDAREVDATWMNGGMNKNTVQDALNFDPTASPASPASQHQLPQHVLADAMYGDAPHAQVEMVVICKSERVGGNLLDRALSALLKKTRSQKATVMLDSFVCSMMTWFRHGFQVVQHSTTKASKKPFYEEDRQRYFGTGKYACDVLSDAIFEREYNRSGFSVNKPSNFNISTPSGDKRVPERDFKYVLYMLNRLALQKKDGADLMTSNKVCEPWREALKNGEVTCFGKKVILANGFFNNLLYEKAKQKAKQKRLSLLSLAYDQVGEPNENIMRKEVRIEDLRETQSELPVKQLTSIVWVDKYTVQCHYEEDGDDKHYEIDDKTFNKLPCSYVSNFFVNFPGQELNKEANVTDGQTYPLTGYDINKGEEQYMQYYMHYDAEKTLVLMKTYDYSKAADASSDEDEDDED